ncbi:leucine-rich repeat-containing protein 2-like [Poecilia formosa]|uniref:leucine-rich repeat-containing protein 2-like n=1 Tax=Poecilia formosa TaxID=48698 RepID=UPI0007B8D383|nr:PREDICTED: leucine-rich repeat-containing protein 2-like [Poecilia formosa]
MGPNRKLDVPGYDLSAVRGIWEVRVKKYRTRQKKEQERVENSALARSVSSTVRAALLFTARPEGGAAAVHSPPGLKGALLPFTARPEGGASVLQQLSTLFVHQNSLSYLPVCLANISSLRMVVASGDGLTSVPTRLCNDPEIKFIRLYDNPEKRRRKKEEEEKKKKEKRRRWREQEVKDGSEKEFMEAYISTLKDRDTVPFSTTKVSISCLL